MTIAPQDRNTLHANFTLSPRLYEEIVAEKDFRGWSVSFLLREAVKEWLATHRLTQPTDRTHVA